MEGESEPCRSLDVENYRSWPGKKNGCHIAEQALVIDSLDEAPRGEKWGREYPHFLECLCYSVPASSPYKLGSLRDLFPF